MRGTADGYLIALDMDKGQLLWSRQIASAESVAVPEHAAAHLRGHGDLRPGRRGLGREELDRRIQAARPASQSGASISSRTTASPAPTAGRIRRRARTAAAACGRRSRSTPSAASSIVPVGNPAPDFYGAAREGDNLYTNSAVALDVRTGKLLWYRQFVSNDVHDARLEPGEPDLLAVRSAARRATS